MPTPKTHRPSVSDIALAAVTRQPRERTTEVALSNDNAKSEVKATIKVTAPDSDEAYGKARDLMKLHLAEFGDPRENGAKS